MPKLYLRIRDDRIEYLVRGLPGTDPNTNVTGTCDADHLAATVARWTVDDAWTLDPSSVLVFVPTASTLSVTCEVPGRNVQQRRRALPFAVEEFVTDDVDDLHIATAAIDRNRPIETLSVPKDMLDRWLEALRNAQIEPGFMTADAYGLPTPSDEALVWFEENLATIRSPEQIATVDTANLDVVLMGLRAEFGVDEDRTVLVQINGSATSKHLRDAGFLASEVRSEVVGPALEYFAQQIEAGEGAAINLLQGDYRPVRRLSALNTNVISGLRWVASLAVVLVGLTAVEGVWASRQADTERERANALYEELFQTRPSGNPSVRMKRALGRLPGDDGVNFLSLLEALAVSLAENVTNFSLRNLSFAKGQRGLIADLTVPSYASLDALEEAVTARGLAWTLSSAQQEDNAVRARIMVEGR